MAKYTWEHIHLRSPDPAATADWYADKLGAEVIRTPQPDGSTRFDLNLTGQQIFIAKADPAATATTRGTRWAAQVEPGSAARPQPSGLAGAVHSASGATRPG